MNGNNFPIRFITDEYFIKDLLKDKALAMKTILKLSGIHQNSKYYPMEHNLISDECLKNAIADKAIRGPALLGAFHSEQWPSFVINEPNIESKIVKWAINIATKKPYMVIILTSNEKLSVYQENKHYSNNQVKSAVKIFSDLRALQVIDIVSRM